MSDTKIIKNNSVKKIFNPILEDLKKVKNEIHEIIDSAFEGDKISLMILKKLFNSTGKLLRPALVVLSAKAVSNNLSKQDLKSAVRLGAAVELIHNASLVHDDIIDDSDFRRSKPSVHKEYNNQIAVLVGDLLYTSALSILSGEFNSEILNNIVKCIQQMASTEIFCLKKDSLNKEEYLKIIIGKTAVFMSSCCETGAMLACNNKENIDNLKNFGLNFGIAYQLIDDFNDGDVKKGFYIESVKEAVKYSDSALKNIDFIENEQVKNTFRNLVAYVVNTDK